MRAWLMNISLVDGWFPATLFSVTAVLAAILLGTAIWETVAGSRDGGKRTFAVVVCPVVIAIIAGIAGLVIAWLLSDVFVVFGVELGPHVVAWAGCGCAIIGFAICYAVQHRGVLRAVAVVLTVFAVLSAATEARWVTPQELDALAMPAAHRKLADKLFAIGKDSAVAANTAAPRQANLPLKKP